MEASAPEIISSWCSQNVFFTIPEGCLATIGDFLEVKCLLTVTTYRDRRPGIPIFLERRVSVLRARSSTLGADKVYSEVISATVDLDEIWVGTSALSYPFK